MEGRNVSEELRQLKCCISNSCSTFENEISFRSLDYFVAVRRCPVFVTWKVRLSIVQHAVFGCKGAAWRAWGGGAADRARIVASPCSTGRSGLLGRSSSFTTNSVGRSGDDS